MSSVELSDVLAGLGLLGGAGLFAGSLYAKNKAKEEANTGLRNALEHAKKSDMSRNKLEKLRSISGNTVNIGSMKKQFQESIGKDNAFWIGDPNYKRYTDKLMTSMVKGNHGTVAIGPDARTLPVIAHELGHATNNRTGAFKSRLTGALIGGGLSLASLLAYKAFLFSAPSTLSRNDLPTAVALGTTFAGLGAVAGGAIADHSVYEEEKKASENAMEYLKSLRRTANQLKEDRRALDSALNTYKTARNWNAIGLAGLASALAGGGYLVSKHL